MSRVDFACHPVELVKVLDRWNGPGALLGLRGAGRPLALSESLQQRRMPALETCASWDAHSKS